MPTLIMMLHLVITFWKNKKYCSFLTTQGQPALCKPAAEPKLCIPFSFKALCESIKKKKPMHSNGGQFIFYWSKACTCMYLILRDEICLNATYWSYFLSSLLKECVILLCLHCCMYCFVLSKVSYTLYSCLHCSVYCLAGSVWHSTAHRLHRFLPPPASCQCGSRRACGRGYQSSQAEKDCWSVWPAVRLPVPCCWYGLFLRCIQHYYRTCSFSL